MKHLLLVEDHFPDVVMMQRALRGFAVPHRLDVVGDGEQALSYLRRTGSYHDRPIPDLVILDLNLPRVTGYEVLQQVKADAQLRAIPVVVLSGSEAPQDVNYCFAIGAAAYLVKAGSADIANQLVGAIEQIWFTLGRTPRGF